MKKLTVFLKQLQLRKIVTIFLATVVVFVGTACSSGDMRGARPDNPAAQAGGANNPYKMGGDSNTNFNISPDPKVNSNASKPGRSRADLQIISNQLIAANDTDKRLYPGAEVQGEPADLERNLPRIDLQDFEAPEPGGQIQRESSVGDRVQDRLSTVKGAFDKASQFINDDAAEALERHETQTKPRWDND